MLLLSPALAHCFVLCGLSQWTWDFPIPHLHSGPKLWRFSGLCSESPCVFACLLPYTAMQRLLHHSALCNKCQEKLFTNGNLFSNIMRHCSLEYFTLILKICNVMFLTRCNMTHFILHRKRNTAIATKSQELGTYLMIDHWKKWFIEFTQFF